MWFRESENEIFWKQKSFEQMIKTRKTVSKVIHINK